MPESREFLVPGAKPKRTFTLNSLKLKPASSKSKHYTESGWPSAKADIIQSLAGDPKTAMESTPVYQQLLTQGMKADEAKRAVTGLRSLVSASQAKAFAAGFVRPLIERRRHNGRIHPSWAFDTSTGRLACRTPNLQNLPAEKDKFRLREAFQAAPGKALIIADYSQLELRVLAHITQCQSMIDAFNKGGDFHSATAADMFSHVKEAVTAGHVVISGDPHIPTVKDRFASERTRAKAVNFGIIFGMEAITLADNLGVDVVEAAQLMDKWYRSKPEVQKWKKHIAKEARQNQYVTSLLGRGRTLPFASPSAPYVYRSKSERAAFNFFIQGSAADIVLGAMLQIWRNARLGALGFRLVMQIHDEVVLEGPTESADEAKEIVQDLMEHPFHNSTCGAPNYEFLVPLSVNIDISQNFSK